MGTLIVVDCEAPFGVGAPYFDDEVHFPDVRIEYQEQDGRWEREDIEVTGHVTRRMSPRRHRFGNSVSTRAIRMRNAAHRPAA